MPRPARFRVFLLSLLLAGTVRADLRVTLTLRDAGGNPLTGEGSAGRRITVELALSVDGGDNPLSDLRFLQFDFGETSAAIELHAFQWFVDAGVYDFRSVDLPVPFAASTVVASPAPLLALDDRPLVVAAIDVTVNANGTLNAVGGTGITETTSARFDAGAPIPTVFSLLGGNLRGGTLALTVAPPPPSTSPNDDASAGDVENPNPDSTPDDQVEPPAEAPEGTEPGPAPSQDQDPTDGIARSPSGGSLCGALSPATILLLVSVLMFTNAARRRARP